MTNPNNVDESDIANVLQAVGPRDEPPVGMKASVRRAIQAEWRASVGARIRRRRRTQALAASVIVALVSVWASQAWLNSSEAIVAHVSRVEGAVKLRQGSWVGRWTAAESATGGQPLQSGMVLETGPNGRVALSWAHGISLRLDHNTHVELLDANRVEVRLGAVYVDSGNVVGPQPLSILTPVGAVRHLGTQYEVRLLNSGVRISVREGSVELSAASGLRERVRAGEQLIVAATGEGSRAGIASDGQQWSWASEVAPYFDIEGHTSREFLIWIGRELGQPVVFANEASEQEATRTILHGSIAGLAPAEALTAVLPTTPLRSTRENGQILIELQ